MQEPAELTLALGILSSASSDGKGTTDRFFRRRHVIRSSWLQYANVGATVRAHFVLRCGGLGAESARAVRTENSSAGDLLCAPVPAADGRMRGPVLSLYFWLCHARAAYPRARFVGKADDDVYLHMPDAEALLLSIPPHSAPLALFGSIAVSTAGAHTHVQCCEGACSLP
jgi:hypothetical protein